MIPIINNPEDRSFTKVFQMMKAKRKSMPQDLLAGFRPRRTSAGAIAAFNLPPLPEPEIIRPLACGGIDGIDDDPEEPEITIPEVCQPFVPIEAGQDEESDPIETGDESGDESSDIGQDAYQAEE